MVKVQYETQRFLTFSFLIKVSIRVEPCLVFMVSVSAACQDFLKPFPNNIKFRIGGGGKKRKMQLSTLAFRLLQWNIIVVPSD